MPRHLHLDPAVREEVAKEVSRIFAMMSSKEVITFDSHAIQIIIFPPTSETFTVPGGPHTYVVRDGTITKY